MQHTIITYPQRPPTSNVLTSSQRQQLQRTTHKLEKVLGTTPQLVDYNYTVHVTDLPVTRNLFSRNPSHRSSHSRTSSLDHYPPLSPTDTIASTLAEYSPSANESLTTRRALSPIDYKESHPKRCSSRGPPQLCLAVGVPSQTLPLEGASRPSVDTIAAGSNSSCASSHLSIDHFSPPLPLSRSYTISIPHTRRPSSLLVQENEPQFRVKSDASMRRQKMERIRKKLGECVPIEAVFPDEDEDEDESRNAILSNYTSKFSPLDAVPEHIGLGEETLALGLGSPSQPSAKPTRTVSGSWGRRTLRAIQKVGR